MLLLLSPAPAACVSDAAETASSEAVVPFHLSPLRGKPPLQWSVSDVEHWMNHTIGYAEYAGYIRAHLIDGVTLLEMEPDDFESFFPIGNALHVVKIAAHVKLLRGLCSCRADGDDGGGAVVDPGAGDFWEYMRRHRMRTWVWGTTVLFFPRWAMAGIYFDKQLYLDVVGKPIAVSAAAPSITAEAAAAAASEVPGKGAPAKAAAEPPARAVDKAKAAIYWVSFAVAPDLYMAYQAIRRTPRNYILMPCFAAHFLAQAFSECSLVYTIYRGTAFAANTPLLERIWSVFSYTLFAPVLGAVVGLVFPVFLQYLTMVALIAHSFLMILGIAILVWRDGLSAATTGPADPNADGTASAPTSSSSPATAKAEEDGSSSKNEKID